MGYPLDIPSDCVFYIYIYIYMEPVLLYYFVVAANAVLDKKNIFLYITYEHLFLLQAISIKDH